MTYKTHVPYDQVLQVITTVFGAPKYYSIVHEVGDENEDCPTPYEHTHAAFIWEKKQQKQGARIFDIGDIHPHVQVKPSMSWMEGIFTKYHLGHKTKKDGKKYFIEPSKAPEQVIPPSWSADIWDGILECKDLKSACEFADVRPKSISDVEKIMKSKGTKRPFSAIEFDCTQKYIDPPKEWDRLKQSLVIVGKAGAGKSNWVRNLFAGGCYEITEMEDLKSVPDDATGLLFDDQEYSNLKIQTQKNLTDVRTGRSVKARNVNGWKPHLPAVFTCNSLSTVLDLNDEAVKFRCYIWDVTDIKMY